MPQMKPEEKLAIAVPIVGLLLALIRCGVQKEARGLVVASLKGCAIWLVVGVVVLLIWRSESARRADERETEDLLQSAREVSRQLAVDNRRAREELERNRAPEETPTHIKPSALPSEEAASFLAWLREQHGDQTMELLTPEGVPYEWYERWRYLPEALR